MLSLKKHNSHFHIQFHRSTYDGHNEKYAIDVSEP